MRTKKAKIAIISSLFLLSIYIIHHYYALITPPKLIYISNNSDDSIISQLAKQGADINLLDYRYIKKYPNIKDGWIRFDPKIKLTRENFIYKLSQKNREKTRNIIMYAGDSIDDFASHTAKQTNISPKKIIRAYSHYAPYKDGAIIAGRYKIPYDATATAIAYYCILKSKERLDQIFEKYNLDPSKDERKKLITIASIIQKETKNKDEMPLIASVIYNRLNKGMKLQLDATLNYGKYSHKIVTHNRIQNDHTRYNTYKYKGLPPEPIGSSSIAAIKAAIDPAKSDYLYFMLAANGSHNFASNYEEHIKHIKWFRKTNDNNKTK